TAIEMLRAQQARTRVTPEEEQEGTDKEDVAIFPLAIPLLAGPGSIATVTALVGRAGHLLFMVPVVIAIAVTSYASYLMLGAAAPSRAGSAWRSAGRSRGRASAARPPIPLPPRRSTGRASPGSPPTCRCAGRRSIASRWRGRSS